MKQVVNSYTLYIPPGNYFLDDIMDIFELLASVSTKVVICTDRYEFESVEEFKEYKGIINKVELIANDPYISVDIEKWVRIYAAKDTPLSRGTIEKIGALTRERVKPFNTKSTKPTVYLTAFCTLSLVTGATSFNLLSSKPTIGIGFILVGLVSWAWAYYTSMYRKSTIKLTPRNQTPGFLKANADKIILSIISAVVGGIIKILFDRLGN